ncbi:hypothetical protein [Rubrivirga sp.]|uniref:hypothetical protein n=1 Tax=Rubrivirga sp. TaxID=1885344 RepID=UPI003B51FBA1
MTLHLHIDRLVLDGLGPLDGDAVAAAIQAEVARLVAEGGVPALDRDLRRPHLDGGAFGLPPGTDAEGVGRHVGRQIYTRLSER